MADKPNSAKKDTNRTWMMAGILIILLLAVFLAWQRSAGRVFKVTQGDQRILILLRGHKMATFELEYTGGEVADVDQVQLKLVAGPDAQVHSDVEEMRLMIGNTVIVLDQEGHVVDGAGFSVNPGDVFTIEMDLYGQSLGQNRLDALWIYINGKATAVEVQLQEAVLDVE
jgi:hypothetical protein